MKVLSSEIDGKTGEVLVRQLNHLRESEPAIPVTRGKSLTRSLGREKFLGQQRLFGIVDDHRNVIGQVVARLSPTLRCPQGNPLGMLGFFAALNLPLPVAQLLREATHWLNGQGATCVVGPMDGDTWHSYRINLGPFEDPPFLMEPTNPPYYPKLWEAAGFSVVDCFHSKRVTDVAAAAEATASSLQRARDRGYRFRKIDMKQFDEELGRIYRISCQSFCKNFLYDEISESEFLELYRPAKAIADPRLVLFAEAPNGEAVGFLFNVVDHYQAVQAMRGQSGLLARVRFLLKRKLADAVNFKSIGILPEHRRKSLAGALMHLGYQATLQAGFHRANLCLIRDGNASSSLDGGQGKILRRYALYQTGSSIFEAR